MRATYFDAERRYEELRRETRSAIQRRLPYIDRESIRLTAIDGGALTHSQAWGKSPSRRVDWSWVVGYPALRSRYPKRFELAVWYEQTLSGLSFGRPSYNGTFLRLDFVEAMPDNSKLKGRIFPISISVAELYAQVVGAQELRIINPINQSVIRYYESFGYTHVSGSNHYLYRRFI